MECYLHHHKFTVIFVVRDKDPETPFSKTEENLFHIIEKIWNNIKKSEHLQQRSLNCFDVQVYTMSDYQYQKNEFLNEVEILRMRIKEIVSGRGRHEYSAPKFAAKVQEHWSNIIRAIDIPTYKVAIAYQRCDEIAKECIVKFEKDLKDMRQKESIKIFPFKVERSIQYSLEQYDKESIYFDKSLTSKHRGDMKCELLKCAEHAFGMTLPALHPQQVMSFGKCVRKRLEKVGDSTRSGREIIEDCITDYMDIYHACCIGLVVPGARWDVHVSDHSLRRALQQKAKEAHEAVALPRRIIVTAKKISIGVMSPLFPVTFPAMGVSGYKLYKSHKFLEKLGDYDPEEPSTAS